MNLLMKVYIISFIAIIATLSLITARGSALSDYKIVSIDSLKNGTYLIYVKDSIGQFFKTISLDDTCATFQKDSCRLMKKGATASLQLKSLYRETINQLQEYDFVSAGEFYRGADIRGNEVPIDAWQGTLSDIYMIQNANGLFYDTAINIDIRQSENKITQEVAQHQKDSIANLINSIKQNLNCLAKKTLDEKFLIYSDVEVNPDKEVIQTYHIVTPGAIVCYKFIKDSLLSYSKNDVKPEFHSSIIKIFNKLQSLNLCEFDFRKFDLNNNENYEDKKPFFGMYPHNPIFAYYSQSNEIFHVLISSYRRKSNDPKRGELISICEELLFRLAFILDDF